MCGTALPNWGDGGSLLAALVPISHSRTPCVVFWRSRWRRRFASAARGSTECPSEGREGRRRCPSRSSRSTARGNGPASVTNHDLVAPAPAERGLFGGEPIESVPSELTSLAFDHDGVLWIGSKYSGAVAFKDGRFTLFDQYNTPLNDAGVSAVFVDAKNTKWFVAARRHAIYTFDNLQWKEIATGEAGADTLHEDRRGRIWCVAGKRLSYIENGAVREFLPNLTADDAPIGEPNSWATTSIATASSGSPYEMGLPSGSTARRARVFSNPLRRSLVRIGAGPAGLPAVPTMITFMSGISLRRWELLVWKTTGSHRLRQG